MVEGLGECDTRVADGKGNEPNPSPIPFEGRDEGEVFLGLLVELNVATEVPAEADVDDDERCIVFCQKRSGRTGKGVSGTPLA